MSKQVLFLLLFAAVVGIMPSCQKDPKPQDEGKKDEMTSREREIYNMLESVGTLSNEVPAGYGQVAQTTSTSKEYAVQGNQAGTRITEKKHCAFGKSEGDFTMLSPWAGVLWPGALIQGGSLRGKSIPNSIPLHKKRKPGRIILQVVGGNGKLGTEKWYKECPMRESDVMQAQNELIRQFLTSSTQADYSISVSSVYSKEDLKVKAGINLKGFGSKFDAAFAGSWNEEKSHVLVKVVQKFFTITYEDPDDGFNGVFTDDITRQELERYTGDGNPICYVSSVSYGRIYYLLIESEADSRALEISAHATYKNMVEASASVEQVEMMKHSKITVCQYGGNATDGIGAAIKFSHDELLKFLQKGAEFGEDNVGAPISFAVKHLYDNSLVHMVNTLEYDYTQTTFVPDKSDELAFMIDDIAFEGTPSGNYNFSNNGKYIVKEITMTVNRNEKKENDSVEGKDVTIPIVTTKMEKDLNSSTLFSIKHEYSDKHGSRVNRINLRVVVGIESEVWKNMQWGSNPTDSKEHVFNITISKTDKGWEITPAKNEGDDYVCFTQRFECKKANYSVKLACRLFVNNRLYTTK
jgi:listeriolysin O